VAPLSYALRRISTPESGILPPGKGTGHPLFARAPVKGSGPGRDSVVVSGTPEPVFVMIYLDYNATTPLAPEALARMLPLLEGTHGNPSSIHAAGRAARAVIDDARDELAALLGGRPHEIIFTGGGTEADNLAVLGLARRRVRDGARRHLITARTEHHAVLHAAEFLHEAEGFEISWLGVDRFGRVDPDELRARLRPDTALVTLMSANNETGTLQPIGEMATICREVGVPFHSDGVQGFGKQPLSIKDTKENAAPDALSLAAHKFYGPKGVGLLWLRAGVPIDRVAHGGAHENERRPGTENPAGIAGMAEAARLVLEGREAEQGRQAALREALWSGLRTVYPAIRRNGHPRETLGNTLNVSFPGLDGESLLINLDLEGIAASSGSACMVGSIQPSHVLLAMGVETAVAHSTVRFSLGKGTTSQEIKNVIARMARIVERLQSV